MAGALASFAVKGPSDPVVLRVLGACTVSLAVAVTIASPADVPASPGGIRAPVVALELARSEAEVERMFAARTAAERARLRDRMELGVWLDYALLLAYGFFLAGLAQRLEPLSRPRLAHAAFGLALLAASADALENRELVVALRQLGGSYQGALARLHWFTWLKWFALGGYFLALAPALWRSGALHRAALLCGALAVASAPFALWLRGAAADAMSLAIALAIALLAARAIGARGSAG